MQTFLRLVILVPVLSGSSAAFPSQESHCTPPVPSLSSRLMHVGITHTWGGAITQLIPELPLCQNLVNNGLPDPGRSIQVAFWDDEESAICWPCDNGCQWRWNPTQGGSPCFPPTFYSGVLDHSTTSTLLSTHSNIYNFDYKDGISNIHVMQNVTLPKSNVVQLDYVFDNNDATHSTVGGQSVPVAFVNTVLTNPWRYTGTAPWTGAAAEAVNLPPNTQTLNFTTTEPWVAWTTSDGTRGLALYAPSGWRHDTWTMHRETSNNVHTMQNWAVFSLAPGQEITQRHFVIYGTLPVIRATVYELENRSWFSDVPFSSPFRPYIHTLFRNGVTSGCADTPPSVPAE